MKEKIEKYITDWERKCYYNGIPDEVPNEIFSMAPSYKRIAMAILKNDYALKSLGFSGTHSIYYDAFKRIELRERLKTNQNDQIHR